MFARWAESTPTSESSPLDNKKWEPRQVAKLRREFRLLKRQSRRRPGQAESEIDDVRFILGKGEHGEEGARPDHPIRSNRQAWFCSQSNFVTFVYPSDGSPFGGSLGTDSLCVD